MKDAHKRSLSMERIEHIDIPGSDLNSEQRIKNSLQETMQLYTKMLEVATNDHEKLVLY